ncbi:hypothetical protein RJT34_31900 [Clitoria ternatea]|uniref:Uncharacterized protein n=1 Tax=Clitoria ternatea TaxID=43366 RepID=A0AAN9I1S1_CLITE
MFVGKKSYVLICEGTLNNIVVMSGNDYYEEVTSLGLFPCRMHFFQEKKKWEGRHRFPNHDTVKIMWKSLKNGDMNIL